MSLTIGKTSMQERSRSSSSEKPIGQEKENDKDQIENDA